MKNERSIFAARKELKEKRSDLLAPIMQTIWEACRLNKESNKIYEQYLRDVIAVLSKSSEPLTDVAIATALHLSPDEYDSLARSLSILAVPSISNKIPNLRKTHVPKTRHYAELDSQGNPIRYWNTTIAEKVYYLKQEEEG